MVRRPNSRWAQSCSRHALTTASLEDGDSIPRLSGWSGVDSGKPRWTWLFASHESSHCQLYYSLTEAPISTDALAHSWPQALLKYAFPPVSLLAQTLCKCREDEEQVLLVAPFWPTRTWFSRLMLLMTAPPWHILLRHNCSHVVLRSGLDTCLMFPKSGGETASTALGGGRSSLGVAVSRKSIAHIRGPHTQSFRSRKRRLSPSRGCPTRWWMPLPWCTNLRVSRAPWGESSLHTECYLYLFTHPHTLYINVIYISK